MLAIVFGLEKFHQFTYGRFVTVESDHKPLESIAKKPMQSAPKRMLLRLSKYDAKILYKPGKSMLLADTLSRAYLSGAEEEQPPEVLQFYEELDAVRMVDMLPVKDTTKAEIRRETASDSVLLQLKETVLQGWPSSRNGLKPELKPYYQVQSEIVIDNDLLFRGNRLIIPTAMRKAMLERIHSSHLGVNGCLRRARDSLYWPGMTADVQQKIVTCEVCRSFEQKQQKEPLSQHDVPSRPRAKLGADLFQFEGDDYLATTDYFSNFVEVKKTTSESVIRALKYQFARHGIPDVLIMDNGPQFTSEKFGNFVKDWQFQHTTSSPGYPQSNGKAENAVKTVKSLMRKSLRAGTDPFLALLAFRNTPTEGVDTSPAQRLFSRRTKTLLPTTTALL